MRVPQVAVATVLAVIGALLAVSPASARPEADPLPRDGDHLPATIPADVPAGGTVTLTSPPLVPDVKALTVTVKPKNKDLTDGDTYDRFVNTIGTLSKGQKLLVCTMMYQSLVAPQDQYTGEFHVDSFFASVAGAVLLACLQLAGLVAGKQAARTSAAGQKCGQIRPSLPATVDQVDGGYSLTASGTSSKAKKPKIKVKCQVTGDTVKYTIKPRKKGQSLRKAVGKKLVFGIKSPADAGSSVPITVTFSRG
jgi:hypothetical protein